MLLITETLIYRVTRHPGLLRTVPVLAQKGKLGRWVTLLQPTCSSTQPGVAHTLPGMGLP